VIVNKYTRRRSPERDTGVTMVTRSRRLFGLFTLSTDR